MSPACPVRGADQGQGRKKEQAQPNAFGTHWECACRGAGKRATGRAPARQEAEKEQGAKLPHQGARVRSGWASLTNPHWPQRGWRGQRGHVISGLLHGCGYFKDERLENGRCLCAFSPHCPDIPGRIFNTTMPKHFK